MTMARKRTRLGRDVVDFGQKWPENIFVDLLSNESF
jgi:hypothetical protein